MRKVSIGFQGGGGISVRVADEALSGLQQALSNDGWHELATADGTVSLRVGEIVYVSTDDDDHKVGFRGLG
jgi:hypothetical protein